MYLGTHLQIFLQARALDVKFKILVNIVKLLFTEVKAFFTEAERTP